MGKIKVTDWGSYIIPEEQETEFDNDLKVLEARPFPEYHISLDRFTQKWYDNYIIPH